MCSLAVYHCSMKSIARSGGRSAVAAIAYRTATKIVNERDGIAHDFRRKQGVEHSEIVLPNGVDAAWALDRSTLWNTVERAERRKDARVAREFEVALPHEMAAGDRLALTRDFACELANRYGAAVDFSIHQPLGNSDIRNVHAHVVMTTRVLAENGLGEKTLIERENKWLLNHDQPTSHMQLRDIRQLWEHQTNRHLARLGLDIRVDHRSHLERGLEIEPTEHMGVHASQMDRRGVDVSRGRIDKMAGRSNGELIRRKPEEVLSVITGEKSVFDRHDVARALHRYIDDPDQFRNAFASVMASPALVELKAETATELARYSTREMVEIEYAMASSADRMSRSPSHPVHPSYVEWALSNEDNAIRASASSLSPAKTSEKYQSPFDHEEKSTRVGLSDEQRAAVHHITGPEQISTVIGFAGAGKSTMLAAARGAWEFQGYRVHGATLAGKAAEGLEESSGIAARTLASWEYGWRNEKGLLGKEDILVIDEAGMVASRQLTRFVNEAESKGFKLVLVGDHEQLQAIGAGSPFRAIAERVGAIELSEIRRQEEAWQREASTAFATHRTGMGLTIYAEHGAIQFLDDREKARAVLVRDYLEDNGTRAAGSRIALAHRRTDVRAINADIRSGLQERGRLARGEEENEVLGREHVYNTHDGERAFARGDRIILLENNRDLGVRNGMLGTVEAVETDALRVCLDGSAGAGKSVRTVLIPVDSYRSFDHGYATTIHKSQGATFDRAFVMASTTMDRHLTYVAMTRHREDARLYVGRDEMTDTKVLGASMGRSGAKETTLDYTKSFATRRGLAGEFGIRSEIAITPFHGAAQPDPALAGESVKPLITAITTYARSIEDIAREKAMPDFDRAMERVRYLGRHVYVDPESAAARIGTAIVNLRVDGHALANSVAEHPERFGELRGKAGFFGNDSHRKAAHHYSKPLGHHVASAAKTWTHRLDEERQSEAWHRRNRDVVEVPGLTMRSENILKQLDALPLEKKQRFLTNLSGTPEGQQVLEETKTVANALKKRFGSSDPRNFKKELDRLGLSDEVGIQRLKDIARLVCRAEYEEISREYNLTWGLKKGLGLRM
ncbi:Ti-type conjugative transfer relaxase TraA [Rhizobium cauense]|uniref:Ti-type conjugative transfer relaxase TraA n=1 Tax=Rhizobium cauense TaxID=1166683 RepID=UPI003B835C3F